MTDNEKSLVMDMCARIPFGCKVRVQGLEGIHTINGYRNGRFLLEDGKWVYVDVVRPQLRSWTSLTHDEDEQRLKTFRNGQPTTDTYNFLNAMMIDYRELMRREVADEVPRSFYFNLNREESEERFDIPF